MQIDLANAIAIGAIIFGIICGLAKLVRDADQKRIEELEKNVADLHKMYQTNVPVVQTQISNIQTQVQTLGDTMGQFTQTQNKLAENLADTREAVAGFGANYVTRRECHEQYPHKRQEQFCKDINSRSQ